MGGRRGLLMVQELGGWQGGVTGQGSEAAEQRQSRAISHSKTAVQEVLLSERLIWDGGGPMGARQSSDVDAGPALIRMRKA
jgi:hypothetical protein